MKRIQFTQTFFEVGGDGYSRAKFEAGQHYEVSDETQRMVLRGIAAEISVPDAPPPQVEASAAPEAAAAAAAAESVPKKSSKKA